jgi:tight adherence protein C
VNVNLLLGATAVSSAAVLLWWALSGSRVGARASARRGLATGMAGPGTDMRAVALSSSAADRAVTPALQSIARRARRITPAGMLQNLERRVLLAGATSWPVERLLVVKVLLGSVVGLLLALRFMTEPSFGGLLLVALGAIGAYLVPDLVLSNAATKRQDRIRLELPDTLDQMTVGVEAGLGFEAAMARAGRSGEGPLAEEIVRTLQEVQAGMSRAEAMRGLAERTDVPELRHFVLAVRQAETYGIPIAQVLRVQAAELRVKRRQRAEEQAQKLPVKVIFPLILCILPAIFVVVIGPAILRVADNLVR